ncbi:MAG: hypothetical protein AAFY59_03510 [Pseudomonadota bacterium]
MIRAFTLLFTALPAMAVALSPLPFPDCHWSPASQGFTNREVGAIPGSLEAFVEDAGNGFYQAEFWDTANNRWGVLQSCESKAYLLWSAPPTKEFQVRARFEALIATSAPVTLQQFSDDLTSLGALTQLGRKSLGQCPCLVLQERQ